MKKRICGFSIYDVRTGGEDLTLSGDYSWRDTGELVKKNQKGAYLPVPAEGYLLVIMNGYSWRW